MKNILLCGVGGQGTVLASKLLASTAIEKGYNVRTAETIGMAQRGGCVVSHVRIGNEIHSPLISNNQADVIIGFEPGEAVRCLNYLKEDGYVIINKKAIKPVTASLMGSNYNENTMIDILKKSVKNLVIIDGEKICNEVGSAKVLNIALLGATCKSGAINFSLEEIENSIRKKINPKFTDMNITALKLGAKNI